MRFLEVPADSPTGFSKSWKQVSEAERGTGAKVEFTGSPFGTSTNTAARLMRAVKLGFKQVLWLLSKLIIASPLFVLLQFVLNGGPYSRYVIVGFVLLVCAFFAALNAFVLVSFIEHFVAKRAHTVSTPRDPEAYAETLVSRQHKELIGRVRALGDNEVMTQQSSCDPDYRLTIASDFLLEEASGRLTYVSIDDPPTLFAPRTQAITTQQHVDLFRLLDHEVEKGGEAVALRDGARVRILTPRIDSVPNLERIEVGDEIKSARPRSSVNQGRYREALGSGQLVQARASTLIIAS